MELQISLEQKQIISQRMVLSMEILQMNSLELEAYIEKLALENPLIELPSFDERREISDNEELERKAYWLENSDYQNRVYYRQDNTADDIWNNIKSKNQPGETLADHLFLQLFLERYTQKEEGIIEFIIYSLDERGYFTEDTTSAAQKFDVPESEILRMLTHIQTLDPPGIAARNLRECLLIQLERSNEKNALAKELVKHYLPDLAKNHIQIIAKKLHVSTKDVEEAFKIIKKLNPRPAGAFASGEEPLYIRPDCVVFEENGQLRLAVNERRQPDFEVSEYYSALIKQTDDKEAKKYLTEKLAQARWVRECILQRKSTLTRVAQEIVVRQESFFFNGEGNKKPMSLAMLSKSLDLHESTISRAMKGKYLQCQYGIYPLNYFLTQASVSSIENEEGLTAEQIKIKIKEIIDNENKQKPLSDQAISDILVKEGVDISRRTVNKYRTQMGLPDKSGRSCRA